MSFAERSDIDFERKKVIKHESKLFAHIIRRIEKKLERHGYLGKMDFRH